MTDTNKSVQTLALDIVSRIATGMGKPFEKQTRLFALPVATVLSDQKAPIRNAALQTLTSIAKACEGVDSMVPGIASALETSNPLQRASLLTWISDWFKDHEPNPSLDLSTWAAPIVACLEDRNGDVRKSAQATLPTLIACAGYDYVVQQTNSLKPASRSTVLPMIQAARAAAPQTTALSSAHPPSKSAAPVSKATSSVAPVKKAVSPTSSSPPPDENVENTKIAPSKMAGVRRRLPQGTIPRPESRADSPVDAAPSRLPSKLATGLKRPAVTTSAKPQSPDASLHMPFTNGNLDVKRNRLVKDVQKWINEGGATRKDLAELLQHQMEPSASKELISLLFSHDHNAVNDHVSGLTMMQNLFMAAQGTDDQFGIPLEDLQTICIANSDLAFKYASIKIHEPQSILVQKCLDVVEAVLGALRSNEYQLSDPEALAILPTIVHKVCLYLYGSSVFAYEAYSSVMHVNLCACA